MVIMITNFEFRISSQTEINFIYKNKYNIRTKIYLKKDVFVWTKKKNEIILFENQGVKLEVKLKR